MLKSQNILLLQKSIIKYSERFDFETRLDFFSAFNIQVVLILSDYEALVN